MLDFGFFIECGVGRINFLGIRRGDGFKGLGLFKGFRYIGLIISLVIDSVLSFFLVGRVWGEVGG